jgi:bacillolysin
MRVPSCRLYCWVGIAIALGWVQADSAEAALPRPTHEELAGFLAEVRPVRQGIPQTPLAELARSALTADGYLRFVGAPPGHQFGNALGAARQPEAVALEFLRTHRRLFGLHSPNVELSPLRTVVNRERHFVRLGQTYSNLPVFAAEATIQVNPAGGIDCVLANLERGLGDWDDQRFSLEPRFAAPQARAQAIAEMAKDAGGQTLHTTPPGLMIFAPAVLEESGHPRLVWHMEVFADDLRVNHQVLVDAHTGELVRRYSLTYSMDQHGGARAVYNANNTSTRGLFPVRQEGQDPTGDAQVDAAYDYLGYSLQFFRHHHSRLGYDGGLDYTKASVRYCAPDDPCPWANAHSYGVCGDTWHDFGDGEVTDDIVGHEFTHSVTRCIIGIMVYANGPGAISESLSDIWGNFIDWSNPAGNDNATNRWIMGEDLPTGPDRDMRDPTRFHHPDRTGSPYFVPHTDDPTKANDNGGVHENCGVGNKLCYLLTDGDTFNGQTVLAEGMDAVEPLYWEAIHLLNTGSGWGDLYYALQQAAINLGWPPAHRVNLYRACLAVEIVSHSPSDLYVDRQNGCLFPNGSITCTMGSGGPYPTVQQAAYAAWPDDTVWIRAGNYPETFTINNVIKLRSYGGPVTIGH